MTPPTTIRVPWPADGTPLDDHIYVDPEDGTFLMKTSGWEVVTMREARREQGFEAFLRNYDRKPWALSYAYEHDGQTKPGYPDFLVIRSDDNRLVVDILEPHYGEDSLDKARGLASFAERHGGRYGRIHMLRYDGQSLRRLKLEDPAVRTALRGSIEQADFVALFE
jgi:type III restriction enzyme